MAYKYASTKISLLCISEKTALELSYLRHNPKSRKTMERLPLPSVGFRLDPEIVRCKSLKYFIIVCVDLPPFMLGNSI